MPLFFQQNINEQTSIGIWLIQEEEEFFLESACMQREMAHPLKRKQHLAGRFLLSILSPGFPLDQVEISKTNKPYLREDTFHFSISHSDTYAAAMVSKKDRVGVDIEMYTSRVMKILHKFLTENEMTLLAVYKSESFVMETLLWSVKESVFKWHGLGDVDFKEHINIRSIEQIDQTQFLISVLFRQTPLNVLGRCFPNFCLTWVITSEFGN